MILGKRAKGGPSKWDLLLAQAEHLLESERCPQCGNPRYICQSDDNDIDFYLYDEVCNATQKRLKHEKRKEKENRDGIVVGTEAYTYSGTDLTSFRDGYYEGEIAKRDRREEEREEMRRMSLG